MCVSHTKLSYKDLQQYIAYGLYNTFMVSFFFLLAPVPNNFHDYDGMFILGRAIPFVFWLYGFLFISPIGTEMFYLCIRASERERERERGAFFPPVG